MTTEKIEQAIAEISLQMKGPLPNLERALLHEDRKDLRRELQNRKELELLGVTKADGQIK